MSLKAFSREQYIAGLTDILGSFDWSCLDPLVSEAHRAWKTGKNLFLCGNGGSAANAVHLANDLIYGISRKDGRGLKAHALSANSAVMTCLANDVGYADIFSQQLRVLGSPGDVLVLLSGSGNSPNIVKAATVARELGIWSSAILGYSGGQCKALVDLPIHFAVDDMQISEDCQLIVGHMVMRKLEAMGP